MADSQHNAKSWQNWVISALATLVMFFAGIIANSLDNRISAQAVKVDNHAERITTLEESKRNIEDAVREIKESVKRIENAVSEQNKRND